MRTKPVSPSREKIAQAKLIYDAGVAPIAEILKLLGMSESQFRSFRAENGWPLRAAICARRGGEANAPPRPSVPPERGLIARLEDAVEREFARAEAALEKHAPKTIEQSARTLASLVKTLGELKRMRRDAAAADGGARDDDERDASAADGTDEPPRELAELRAELARRLERLRGDGAAR